MTIEHGLRVPMVGTPQDTGAYARQVEADGFDFMWVPDTPLLAGLWRDVYMHLTCAALETSKIFFCKVLSNTLIFNSVFVGSAIVTLDEVSDGRAEVPYGTGYSSAYIIGRKAATLKLMREAAALWRGIFTGERTQLGGLEIELDPPRAHIPIIMAASGPKALQTAGEVADGVLIMVGAHPGCVEWALEHVNAGIAKAGRAASDVKKTLVITACVDDDRQRAIDTMRPCVGNLCRHRFVGELFDRAGLTPPPVPDNIPQPYPDLGHAIDWEEAKRATAWIPDDVVAGMNALGSGAEVAERVQALSALDIDAIWWRDHGTWAHPEALRQGLVNAVFPRL
ncbi:MAG: LLM class flavin-dependent oxidoreductase [Rhodospirillaceae bacterium]|nr:LLM class flavin-dependent oxidoreductase [Rhodospirillaceae bacterium]